MTSLRRLPFLLVLLSGVARAAPPEEPPPMLLVLPVETRNGVTPGLAITVSETLTAELRRSRKFRVSTLSEVEGVLTQALRAQVAGCEGDCAVEMGTLVEADQILGGALGRVGDDYVLNVHRLSARDGQALAASTRRVPVAKETGLLDVLPAMALEIVQGHREAEVVLPKASITTPPDATQVAAKDTPASKARGPIKMAVMPLDNRGKRADLEVLSKGLADILITDLNQVEGVQVVERERLAQVMGELRLEQGAAFDAATTQKLGRLLGVEFLVFGTYWEFLGNFRMDAYVVKVETAGHLAAQGVTGKPTDVLEMEKQLVVKLLESVSARISQQDRTRLTTPAQGASLDEVVAYSNAVDALDKGDKKAARTGAMAVLAKLPGFAAAQSLLKKADAPR